MSGPNPPGSEGSDLPGQEPGNQPTSDQSAAPDTGETEFHSQAYSAPESEQFTSGPYVPADASLYDYDSYDPATELVDQREAAALALGGRASRPSSPPLRSLRPCRCWSPGPTPTTSPRRRPARPPRRRCRTRSPRRRRHHRLRHHPHGGATAATAGDRDGDAGAVTSAPAAGHRRGAAAATGRHDASAAAPDDDRARGARGRSPTR